MGLRDKFQRAKDSLRREHTKNDSRQSPGGVKQLVESTITSASQSTSTSTGLLGVTSNVANITAGVQSSRDPASPTNIPIVQTKSQGTMQLDESKDLWLQACDTLRLQEPELMDDYSRILLREANVTPGSSTTQDAPISNGKLIKLMKAKLDGFTIPSSRSGDKIEKIVKVVIAAKTFIGSTLESEPHAAIAWAGVSVFLPLLINPITEKAGCREGLENIPPLIDRYALLEASIWDPTSTDEYQSSAVKLQLRKAIIQLYAKILLYEARVISQFCGNSVTGYFRDALKLNDWTTMFREMNELDHRCGDLIYAIDRDLNRKTVEKQQTLLAEALDGSKTSQKTRDYQECFQSFRSGNLYELQKNQNPSRIPGTCKWVLEHPTFIDWKEGSGPGVLWISADPGYGKSVLSKALIDENLVASEQNTDVCYFFFKDISKEQRSLTKALAALLHQIFSSQKHLLVYTESSWAKNNTEIANLAHEMWGIVKNIATSANTRNIICILDALDECDASERKFFLKQLQALYRVTVPDIVTHSSSPSLPDVSLHSHIAVDSRASTISTGSPDLKVKFLITSRPYYEIEEEFKSLTDVFSGIRLAGEDTTATIKEEINLVIDAEVDKLKLSSKADTRLRSRLKDIEHRTYLWLYLIMDTIRLRAKASRQSKTFERILDAELPSTIDEAYEAILDKSPDKKEATKLLHIVIGAERPLALDELNIALNIDESYDGSQSFEDIELEDPELFPKRIRDICGLSVSISDSKVYLIHQTAKEFLVAKGSSLAATGWRHSLHTYDSQSILTKICISYLYLNTFSEIDTGARCFITSPKGQPNISNEDQFKFLKYASDYWMKHWKISSSHIDVRTIIDLCSPTVRRSMWFRACFGVKYPPKYLWRITHRIRNVLKVDDFEEVNTISPLMIALGLDLLDISKALLATPLSQSELNQSWRKVTAVSFAIRMGDYEMTRALISAGANIGDNSADEHSRTALEVALDRGDDDILNLLFENKAGTHAALCSALGNYVVNWDPRLIDLLLVKNGPLVPSLRVRLLLIALSTSIAQNKGLAVKFVLACPHEQSMDETLQKPLYSALTAYYLDFDICSLIIDDPAIHDLDKCWELNNSTGNSQSIVHHLTERLKPNSIGFCRYSDGVRLLKLLGARGASFDRHFDGSAFLDAAWCGRVDYFEVFLQKDPQLASLYINKARVHSTPLDIAINNSNHDMIRCLLKHGARFNQSIRFEFPYLEESYFFTIFTAFKRGDIDKTFRINLIDGILSTVSMQQLQKLIGYGFDINLDIRGQTLLSHAASSGNSDWVQWLIDHGANVDDRFSNRQSIQYSPLMEAIWYCDDSAAASGIIKILHEHGANIDGPRDYKGRAGFVVASSVHLAIIKCSVKVLQTLLECNADVNLHGENYGIPLKEATMNGQVHLLKLLVSYGADVNAVVEGIPILHQAIFNRKLEAVAVLLDLGAYINILECVRGTPLQLAKDMHYVEMVLLLQSRGALEVCNLKPLGTSYFYHQSRGHTSTNSLAFFRKDIEMPAPEVSSRRRSLNLQTWGTYTFDHHGTVASGPFHEEVRNYVLSDLSLRFEKRKEVDSGT
ncbi:uncharacterized protein EAF01_011894 [Botrytis porri]|uniref:uncharacterized protein n=1 Tax=Botrytis porri TaxID=87229 RepID=UPI0019012041|nr:uncharacterized protein EAF01_011894 [Botrytis porri]KAF7881383.1 hypothetical protein EAF01_011894 [Botrytis porri]